MIITLAKTTLFLIMGLLLAWGFCLNQDPAKHSLEEEILRATHVIDDPTALQDLEQWGLWASRLPDLFFSGFPSSVLSSRLRAGAGVTGVHLAILLLHLPSILLLTGGAWTLGLWARERTRHGTTYASPSRAFLSKHLAIASILILGLFALSPLAFPLWIIWVSAVTLSFGAGCYVANLPIRL